MQGMPPAPHKARAVAVSCPESPTFDFGKPTAHTPNQLEATGTESYPASPWDKGFSTLRMCLQGTTQRTQLQLAGNAPNLWADHTEMHFGMLLQMPCQLDKALALPIPEEEGQPHSHHTPFPQGIYPTSATTCPAHLWGRQQRGCSSASKPTHPNFLCNPPHSHMHHPPGLHFWRSAWAAAVSYFSAVDDLNSFPALRGRQ